jgi:catechol 2,3-dioxygenase-like lactoylglutathione lyase family enzyme
MGQTLVRLRRHASEEGEEEVQEVSATGGCHCGAVRFEVDLAPDELDVLDCNCSICAKKGMLHLIVAEARFRITQGEDALATYTFGTHVAKHTFCRTCGVQAFYRPRSHPDCWDVNARCLDEPRAWRVKPFDGAHWDDAAATAGGLALTAIALVVPDYDEAIAFYTRTLGFTLVEDTALPGGKRWVHVRPPSGGAGLILARAASDAQRVRIGDQTGGRVFMFVHTLDFTREHARLVANGVRFLEPPRREAYGTVAVFVDPWGNKIDLIGP